MEMGEIHRCRPALQYSLTPETPHPHFCVESCDVGKMSRMTEKERQALLHLKARLVKQRESLAIRKATVRGSLQTLAARCLRYRAIHPSLAQQQFCQSLLCRSKVCEINITHDTEDTSTRHILVYLLWRLSLVLQRVSTLSIPFALKCYLI